MEKLVDVLLTGKKEQDHSSLYAYTQVNLAYNSNRMEGSQLTDKQTKDLFETNNIPFEHASTISADDIVEMRNHFRLFDFILETYREELSVDYLKSLHKRLKRGTLDEENEQKAVGDFKKTGNIVGELKRTSLPENVISDLEKLLSIYLSKETTLLDVVDFHAKFEAIHPFSDGNGRIGRLILFKECLKNGIVPFIITDQNKLLYQNALYEYQMGGHKNNLVYQCLIAQINYESMLSYYRIKIEKSTLDLDGRMTEVDALIKSGYLDEHQDLLPPTTIQAFFDYLERLKQEEI